MRVSLQGVLQWFSKSNKRCKRNVSGTDMKSYTRSGGSFRPLTPETGERQQPEMSQMPLIQFLNLRARQDARDYRVYRPLELSKLDPMVKDIMSPKLNVDQCIKALEALDDMFKLTNQEWTKVMARVFGLKWEQLQQSDDHPWEPNANQHPEHCPTNWDHLMRRTKYTFPINRDRDKVSDCRQKL